MPGEVHPGLRHATPPAVLTTIGGAGTTPLRGDGGPSCASDKKRQERVQREEQNSRRNVLKNRTKRGGKRAKESKKTSFLRHFLVEGHKIDENFTTDC
jgi:hypothetical protein